MFRITHLWSLRRLRSMRRILIEHYAFSVEVCLSDMSGTQTAAEKRYQVGLKPSLASTQSMSFLDRFLLRLAIIRYGQRRVVSALINQVLYLDFEPDAISYESITHEDGVWVYRFRLRLTKGESMYLLDMFPDQLQPA
jgi:hypothetical protein